MIEYVYLPNYDGEDSVFVADEVFEPRISGCGYDGGAVCGYGLPLEKHRTTDDFTVEDVKDAVPAKMVVSLDDTYGDVTPRFIREAVELLRRGIDIDLKNGDGPKVSYDDVAEWEADALIVLDHNRTEYDGACNNPDLCGVCENIYDLEFYQVTPALSDYGYVVETGDGKRIFKVEGGA